MLTSHGEQLSVVAEIYNKDGALVRSVTSNNNTNPAPHEIEITVKNKDNTIDRIEHYPFRSFTYNWIYLLEDFLSNTNNNPKLKTDGTTYSGAISEVWLASHYTTINAGIIVGRSSTSVTASDPYLFSVCANGTGTNQLDYSSTIVEEPEYNSPYYQMVVRRVITNYSGSDIIIREVGLVGNDSTGMGSGTPYLLARDVEDYTGSSINLTISHNQSFEVKYIFRYDTTTTGFVQNYLKAIYALTSGEENFTLTETDGSSTTSLSSDTVVQEYFNTTAAYGYATFGIIVGKGTTTPTYQDFQMDDTIAHGSVDGRLLYGGMEFEAPTIDGNDVYCQVRRAFVNDGSTNISISEAGLVGYNYNNGSYVMLMHIPFTGLTLQPTESVRIIFKIKTTV